MTLRKLLAAGIWVALVLPALVPGHANARDLTLVGRGAAMQQILEDVDAIPFSAITGIGVSLASWPGGVGALRSHAEAGDWDVVLLQGDELLAGCDDGLLEKLAWPQLGFRDKLLPGTATDCGAGALVGSLALAWDRDKFPGTPSWADFWDVARYPGKRGLRRSARSNLEIALLADGVGAGDVYRLLRTEDGVDRAFRKLEQIKPYLVWWAPDTQAAQLLGSGEVLMSSADNLSIAAANRGGRRRFGLQWSGSLYTVLSWGVVKNTPDLADANRLLAFMADPARQTAVAVALGYGPAVRGAADLLPPDGQAASPTAPANLQNALQVDEQFWRDNGDKLNQRFEAWLAH